MRDLPIGVFDSGVGGLTVLAAIHARSPAESILYLGDTARLPYGAKSPETVARYAVQAAGLLVARGVKMLVIACNTASAHALEPLRRAFPGLPVLGVVEPGAAAAAATSANGRIAVLATEATVRSGAYERAIRRLRPDAQVVGQPCSVFVALAEEGWTEGEAVDAAARRYLSPLLGGATPPDTLMLGCTHFPILTEAIRKAAGPDVMLVDSASTAAEMVAAELERRGLETPGAAPAELRFLATDGPERFARVAGHFLGRPVAADDVELVELHGPAPTG